ncbi:Uncharacterised protein [Klebsiella pneumoniae]|nr:Uncharacterised protein [Klebsiella pneumoniae]
MYFWYSFSVVAPIRLSSPRAIIGLNTLATSSPPSPPPWPAPTMVCTSSMNKISSPWCSVTSFSTFCTRSSNSPRYLAPATMALMLSSTRRLSRKVSGTSPATMRCASPSTMAVLPTPGSPISTGLFFLRRASTSMVVSISCARPITGSSLPSRAILVRSREYLSSSGVLVGVSARPSSAPLPTTLLTCWRSACGVRP